MGKAESVRGIASAGLKWRGRRLSSRRQLLMEQALPKLEISVADTSLKACELFAFSVREIWCEIGFGGGEHLLAQARRHPQIGFVGIEPFLPGMVKTLAAIEAEGLRNIRLSRQDAGSLLPRFGRGSFSRIYCLFPDPWPKRRHHKRRLLCPAFIDEQLAPVLTEGGEVRIATDWSDYAHQIMRHFRQDSRFVGADTGKSPPDHVTTRYQSKRLGDCEPVFLSFTAVKS